MFEFVKYGEEYHLRGCWRHEGKDTVSSNESCQFRTIKDEDGDDDTFCTRGHCLFDRVKMREKTALYIPSGKTCILIDEEHTR